MLIELGLFIYIYILGLITFLLKYKHLLLLLLSLEFIVLSLYYGIFFFLSFMGYERFFIILYLILSVSEGVLGLGILVIMIRSHGSDYVLGISFLW